MGSAKGKIISQFSNAKDRIFARSTINYSLSTTMNESSIKLETYQGQFGTFIITAGDRQGVIIYRMALMVASVCFAAGTVAILSQSDNIGSNILDLVTWLYIGFSVALGIALATIHIYLAILHRVLQIFWAIGSTVAMILGIQTHQPIALVIYQQPLTILGIGFTFAALTGIFFKEAFCFDRIETKILTFLVPLLLLGHLINFLPQSVESILLATWAGLFIVFALRKAIQAIPPDIGDKSVFEHLKASV
jgi:uncharacterized integral membrane protein